MICSEKSFYLYLANLFFAYALCGVHNDNEDKFGLRRTFEAWKVKFDKRYKTSEEHEARLKAFSDNLRRIDDLNAAYRDTEFVINHLADMSEQEFQTKVLMPKRMPVQFPTERYASLQATDPLPASFDWRDKNMVTSVKDQGAGGTCWAFSAIGNIEGQWAKLSRNLTSLSVEQIVDCDDMQDDVKGHADCGIFGGWPYLAYQYVKRQGGLETDQDYSYCSGKGGAKGTCFMCQAPHYNKTLCGPPIPWCNETCADKINPSKFVPGLKVVDWRAISQNETVIAQHLMSTGPLSVALNANQLQFYHRGVFNPIICEKASINHAVLIVGFAEENGIFGKKPYWIVKNSWGEKWGQQGYFFISRGTGKCGINTQVTTSVLGS